MNRELLRAAHPAVAPHPGSRQRLKSRPEKQLGEGVDLVAVIFVLFVVTPGLFRRHPAPRPGGDQIMTNPQSPFAVASCTLQTSLRGEGPGTPHLPARAASRVCPSPAPGRSRLAPRPGLIPVLDPAPFEGSKLFQHSRNVPFCFSSLLHPLYFPSCATGSAFPGQAPGAFLAREETRDRLDAPRCTPWTPLPQPCHPRGTCSLHSETGG